MPEFIPGIELGRRFYWEAVRPVLDAHFPGLPHAAAHIGWGSDVLGFDTEMSRDHGWGPSVVLFVRDEDVRLREQIGEILGRELPREFYGYSTHFGESPAEPGTPVMEVNAEGPINHHVSVTTLRAFVWRHLGYDIDAPVSAADWLTFSTQGLLEVTAGVVHYDSVGDLTTLRERLGWYPHNVWLYMLASGWQRIGQEEPLMSRAGHSGDEIGSAIMGSRLVRDIMSLCFLMEGQYAPYPKWFGTGFLRLDWAPDLMPMLRQALVAEAWHERESTLTEAREYLARKHNALGITKPLPDKVSSFFGRPFMVIWGERFASAIRAEITDPEVQHIASRRLIGSVDQFSDSTDIRSDPSWRPILRSLYL
jgi:hypothetical protein